MNKEKKLKPSKELPLGFTDRQEKELLTRDFIISNIKEVMVNYGFQYLETPSFEYSDSIGKFLPDKDRPDEGIFSFKDENKWLSLRYDLTAPLARYVAKNYQEISKPFKRFQLGKVWRNEKPGPGRFREFLQLDADFVGTKNLQADAELCILLADTLTKCGLDKNEFEIKVSNRKCFFGLLDWLKATDEKQRIAITRAVDKYDKIGIEGVASLLGKGRKDKSGDFTKGVDLSKKQIEDIIQYIKDNSLYDDENYPKDRFVFAPLAKWDDLSSLYNEGIKELSEVFAYTALSEFKDQIVYSPTLVRGIEYYTGTIFEANLLFKVKNQKGQEIEFGSVGGGGRYDNLINRFGNLDVPCTGVSFGIDRLVFALMQKKDFEIKTTRPVVICVFDKSKISEYSVILNRLRSLNISSEIYPGEGKLKKQMEYANKIGSPAVILYGDDEIKSGNLTLKNLETGNESSVKIEDLVDEIKKII
ncbi:MAG: histidyl-tRNA synthetase [Pelagibacterales bacterium]|nr:histidyl-tRNA synthetase [Pelagibacterales bacterium]